MKMPKLLRRNRGFQNSLNHSGVEAPFSLPGHRKVSEEDMQSNDSNDQTDDSSNSSSSSHQKQRILQRSISSITDLKNRRRADSAEDPTSGMMQTRPNSFRLKRPAPCDCLVDLANKSNSMSDDYHSSSPNSTISASQSADTDLSLQWGQFVVPDEGDDSEGGCFERASFLPSCPSPLLFNRTSYHEPYPKPLKSKRRRIHAPNRNTVLDGFLLAFPDELDDTANQLRSLSF